MARYLLIAAIVATLCTRTLGYTRLNRSVDLKTTDNPRKVIRFGMIVPYSGPYPWVRQKAFPAVLMALEEIDENKTLLAGYDLEIIIGNSACSNTKGPLVAIDLVWTKAAHVFLGPVCDFSVGGVALYSGHWNIPVLSPGAQVGAFENKTEYPLLTRIYGSYRNRATAVQAILSHFNWTTVSFIYYYDKKSLDDYYYQAARAIYHTTRAKFMLKYPNQKPSWHILVPSRTMPDYGMILRKVTERARGKGILSRQPRTRNSVVHAVSVVFDSKHCRVVTYEDFCAKSWY